MLIELEGQLINMHHVRNVTFEEAHDLTVIHYLDGSMESFKGDLRVPILAAAGGKSVEAA